MNSYVNLRLFGVLLSLLTASCSSLQPQYASVEDNPYYLPPPGSELLLLQPLEIPPKDAAVHLQQGKVVHDRDVDRYKANCKFETTKRGDVAQNIKPDTFLIPKVSQQRVDNDASLSIVEYTNVYYMQSALQPDVLRLSCKYWGDPVYGRFLTLKEVRDALGKIMTVNLK